LENCRFKTFSVLIISMSEDLYQVIEEELRILAPIVRMNEIHKVMHQLNAGKISNDEAISKIYFENTEKPAEQGKYKKRPLETACPF
jgi:hypothetical protein